MTIASTRMNKKACIGIGVAYLRRRPPWSGRCARAPRSCSRARARASAPWACGARCGDAWACPWGGRTTGTGGSRGAADGAPRPAGRPAPRPRRPAAPRPGRGFLGRSATCWHCREVHGGAVLVNRGRCKRDSGVLHFCGSGATRLMR